MTTFTSVSIDKADKHDESFLGYAWLTVNGERIVHASIEGTFKVKKVAGESKVFLQAVVMDGEGSFNLMDVNTSEIETKLEEELQLS